jgi:phosphinothricin acetyltransferase
MAEKIDIREMQESDGDEVMRIFNHYARTSYAAYPDGPLPAQFFAPLREGALSAVVLENNGEIAGFGLLKPFLPFAAFRKTGMVTYFIAPEFTGRGLGTSLLARLKGDAKKAGQKILVANISSKNEASIRFHVKQGFTVAGSLAGVGEKFGEPFDVIWMQRAVE